MKEALDKGAEALKALSKKPPKKDDEPKSARDVVRAYAQLIKDNIAVGHSVEDIYEALVASKVFDLTFKLKLDTFKLYVAEILKEDRGGSKSRRGSGKAKSAKKATGKAEEKAEEKTDGRVDDAVQSELDELDKMMDEAEIEAQTQKPKDGLAGLKRFARAAGE